MGWSAERTNYQHNATATDRSAALTKMTSVARISPKVDDVLTRGRAPRNEAQQRVKKDAVGQVAVSVRIYEVLGHIVISDPAMEHLTLPQGQMGGRPIT